MQQVPVTICKPMFAYGYKPNGYENHVSGGVIDHEIKREITAMKKRMKALRAKRKS